MKKILLLIILAFSFKLEATVVTGKCGELVSYNLDTETGILKILGTGKMYNYEHDDFNTHAPWNIYKDSITTVQIQTGVTSIGESSFYNMLNIESVRIPTSVTSVGFYAFQNCEKITTPLYTSELFIHMPTNFEGAFEIPSGTKYIATTAFMDCSGLTAVSIPNTVIEIGDEAFYNCSNLETVIMGTSLEKLGYKSFANCGKLEYINLPNSLKYIRFWTFHNCSSLKHVKCESTTPPTCEIDAFSYEFIKTGTLYVQKESIDEYRSAPIWKYFRNTIPIEIYPTFNIKMMTINDFNETNTGINNINLSHTGKPVFNLSGQKLQKYQRGINIINGVKVLYK